MNFSTRWEILGALHIVETKNEFLQCFFLPCIPYETKFKVPKSNIDAIIRYLF